MTHHPIRIEPDGTRRYSNGTRYKPLTAEQRVNGVRRPADPRALRFHGQWFLPLELLPDEARQQPETRPDSLTLDHRATCRCSVCKRPEARILWARRRNSVV